MLRNRFRLPALLPRRRAIPLRLPLIFNRLELITTLAPESMDDVNAAAFAEAYKDLVNMVYRLMGQ